LAEVEKGTEEGRSERTRDCYRCPTRRKDLKGVGLSTVSKNRWNYRQGMQQEKPDGTGNGKGERSKVIQNGKEHGRS